MRIAYLHAIRDSHLFIYFISSNSLPYYPGVRQAIVQASVVMDDSVNRCNDP